MTPAAIGMLYADIGSIALSGSFHRLLSIPLVLAQFRQFGRRHALGATADCGSA
jgi:hypothetical protein